MGRRKNTQFELHAVKAWYRVVSASCGGAGPSELDRREDTRPIKASKPLNSDQNSAKDTALRSLRAPPQYLDEKLKHVVKRELRHWRGYKEGRNFPLMAEKDEKSQSLPERVEVAHPGTISWLVTPFWRLCTEEPPTHRALLDLVSKMPPIYRERLIATDRQGKPIHPGIFLPICKVDVEELASLNGPWVLGSLACIARIAELKGDSRLRRYAITGLLRMLWLWQNHFALREDFPEIWNTVVARFRDPIYFTPSGDEVRRPIQNLDLEKFDRTVERHRNYRKKHCVESALAEPDLREHVASHFDISALHSRA